MPFEFITRERYSALQAFALADPPTWTRLEPQSTTGDPQPGTEARVHDPLWLMGRQWQLGEFEGEDAGTPVTVRVVSSTRPVDRWAPGGQTQGRPIGSAPQDLLEPLVEREPVLVASPGLRPRAEAGAALVAALDEAGLSAHAATIVAQCPLVLDPSGHPGGAQAALDPAWLRLVRMLGDAELADAETFAAAVEGRRRPAALASAGRRGHACRVARRGRSLARLVSRGHLPGPRRRRLLDRRTPGIPLRRGRRCNRAAGAGPRRRRHRLALVRPRA